MYVCLCVVFFSYHFCLPALPQSSGNQWLKVIMFTFAIESGIVNSRGNQDGEKIKKIEHIVYYIASIVCIIKKLSIDFSQC